MCVCTASLKWPLEQSQVCVYTAALNTYTYVLVLLVSVVKWLLGKRKK